MKTILAIVFAAGASILATPTYASDVTLVAKIAPPETTNGPVMVAEGEVAEVISYSLPKGSYLEFLQDNTTNWARLAPTPEPYAHVSGRLVVAGPGSIRLVVYGDTSGMSWRGPSLATIHIAPESFPPDKTLIIPPGTNQFAVSLESSTNLVQWTTATNGVYGRPDEARFFRIKLEKVP